MTNQLGTYYRDGTYDDCPRDFRLWRNCLSAKLSKAEAREEIFRSEWADRVKGHHIFLFRPSYAEEARERYGVMGSGEANAHSVAHTPAPCPPT